ncbi:3280_t:CDS:2 [Ambispora leptoticha]|uniref:3280_t:CDS:1 n=1 Tax=Ambispora leptoticha TaxID=144679 RepID=A0A9N9CSZ1_9GLOM|nr:3280_t:CDS:2 [Ambispora leptoticha]
MSVQQCGIEIYQSKLGVRKQATSFFKPKFFAKNSNWFSDIGPNEGIPARPVALIIITLLLHYALPKVLAQQETGPTASNDDTSSDNSTATTPQCGGGTISGSDYNLGLHVGALFIILATSSFGAFVPVIAKKYPSFRIPQIAFMIAKHFGTGVILATAFIHMLPSAFGNLTNPCLPSVWSNDYTAFAGAIAMGSALIIFIIEYFTIKTAEEYEEKHENNITPHENGSHINNEIDVRIDEKSHDPQQRHHHGHMMLINDRAKTIGIVILEAGICFHSVIIGMALSVSTGSDFISLLCALVFHQMFEGLGLGARIAELSFPSRSLRPWLMSLAYGTTTPIGIAIGIGVRYSYDPQSETAIIVQGVLDSISAGILLYAAMVELLAADFIADKSIRKSSNSNQAFAFTLLLLGAGGMALIGRWA